MSGVSLLVVIWSLLSCGLALAPVGFGGVPRAVNGIVFMVAGPGIALATFLNRRYTVGSTRVLAPRAVAVIAETFSLTLLVLISMLLLLVGAWTVPAVVGVVTAVTVVLALVPGGSVAVEALESGAEPELVALPVATSGQVPVAARAALPASPGPPGRPALPTHPTAQPGRPAVAAPVAAADKRPPTDDIVMWS